MFVVDNSSTEYDFFISQSEMLEQGCLENPRLTMMVNQANGNLFWKQNFHQEKLKLFHLESQFSNTLLSILKRNESDDSTWFSYRNTRLEILYDREDFICCDLHFLTGYSFVDVILCNWKIDASCFDLQFSYRNCYQMTTLASSTECALHKTDSSINTVNSMDHGL